MTRTIKDHQLQPHGRAGRAAVFLPNGQMECLTQTTDFYAALRNLIRQMGYLTTQSHTQTRTQLAKKPEPTGSLKRNLE